ncbi:N-acetyltransferase [Kribbella antibiotica]|uniref:N-acetyltransferase n=1 Tax=Kribbella antibiotica TaxID=190195 RepID=A0A4R4YNS4_9ACTN|nr:GNAT family N-acetyltransferase [Kribbella antibiotica]TDD46683.1 N-acetyltransferase [Kribbella antibiotica]
MNLSTRRLIIRQFQPDDLADFHAYQADPLVRRYLPGEPMSVEQAAEYLASQAELGEREVGAWHGYAVQDTSSGKLIGDIGVYLASAVEGDIGFQFAPAFHRQGYGHEAATTFLAYLFEELGLARVTAGCDEANAGSRALIGSLGMTPQPGVSTDGSCRYELPRDQAS